MDQLRKMRSRLVREGVRALVVVCLLGVTRVAVANDDLDREFAFASGLVEMGFPDYADKVVQNILRLHPREADRAKVIQAEILIDKRKFPEAEALVDALKTVAPEKADAIRLKLARSYYQYGEIDKSKQLYQGFFAQYAGKKPTDPDLLRVYQEAAYQFGYLMEQAQDYKTAAQAYERVLDVADEKGVKRRMQSDLAQMYVQIAQKASGNERKDYLQKARKLCEAIQWGGLDAWFGQSIVTLANIEIVEGNKKKAQDVLKSNRDILKSVDDYLKENNQSLAASPVAGARYLAGELFEEEAEGLAKDPNKADEAVKAYSKALGEFYNVFVKYGESDWGARAGARAQAIKTILEDRYGKTVNINLGEAADKAAAVQFRMGDNLFRQKKYAEAIDEYRKTLNAFPEAQLSVNALINLLLSYLNTDDELYARMTARYLAERFAGSDTAALGLLGAGKQALDANKATLSDEFYTTYLAAFPKHEKAGLILYYMADRRGKVGDSDGQIAYLKRIVKDYPRDAYYPRALSRLAWGAYEAGDYTNAVEAFTIFLKEAQPSPEKAQAQFCLADSLARTDDYVGAIGAYQTLVQWLLPEDNPYGRSAADVKKNKALLEKALFQIGYALARLPTAPDKRKAVRDKAIKAFDYFIRQYPTSELGPKAYSLKAAVQFEIEDYAASAQTSEALVKAHPDSEEAQNARFSQVISAIEVNKLDMAADAFNNMVSQAASYKPADFARVGQLLLDAGLNEAAGRAFAQVIASGTDERALLERALYGQGVAAFEQKDYARAAEALGELMERYPKSGLFYDAKFMLGESYTQMDRLDEATDALGDVFKFADNAELINRASLKLGAIQERQGDRTQAFASYQRVALLANPAEKALRPLIEQSILESIRLAMALERYADAVESCEQYLDLFPGGNRVDAVRKDLARAKLKAAEAEALSAAAKPNAKP